MDNFDWTSVPSHWDRIGAETCTGIRNHARGSDRTAGILIGLWSSPSLCIFCRETTAMMDRRFPPPWSVEEGETYFIIKDSRGQKLAVVYTEILIASDPPGLSLLDHTSGEPPRASRLDRLRRLAKLGSDNRAEHFMKRPATRTRSRLALRL
jgi:hypothetical protein